MAFIAENRLEELLVKAANTSGLSKEYEIEFRKEFLNSEIFVLVNKEVAGQDGEEITINNDTRIDFVAKYINDKPCLPVFSSLTDKR